MACILKVTTQSSTDFSLYLLTAIYQVPIRIQTKVCATSPINFTEHDIESPDQRDDICNQMADRHSLKRLQVYV